MLFVSTNLNVFLHPYVDNPVRDAPSETPAVDGPSRGEKPDGEGRPATFRYLHTRARLLDALFDRDFAAAFQTDGDDDDGLL